MPKASGLDAYLYTPIEGSEGYALLMEKIKSEVRVTEGRIGVNEYIVCKELAEDSTPTAYLFFGKDLTVPVGVMAQKGRPNGTICLDVVVGILHDSSESYRRGYRENIEGVMLNKLGLKQGDLKYAGLYSQEHGKIVIDFDKVAYV